MLRPPEQSAATQWTSALPILLGLAIVLGFLHWARPVLIPVALAILITFLLAPLVRKIARVIGGVPATVLVTLSALVLTVSVGWVIARQVGELVESYPKYERNINEKIASLRWVGQDGTFDKARDVGRRIERQLKRADVDVTPEQIEARRAQVVRVVVDPGPFRLSQFWPMLQPVLAPLAAAALVVVLVFFMLLGREDMRDRFIALVGERQLAKTTRALDDAGSRISRFLVTQLVINAAFGIVVAIGLYFLDIPFAPLWGAIAFALRYIPYLGPWIAMVLPLAMSLLVTRDWATSLGVIALFGVVEGITNLIVEPMLYGRGIGVSQPALLVAVAFWTWLWGPVGLVLASPLTVCLVVLGRHVPRLRFFDTLLGDTPALDPQQRFYQRLLARDYEGAGEVARSLLQERPLVEVFEQLLLPALSEMRNDVRLDLVSEASADAMTEGVREIAEELAKSSADAAAKAASKAEAEVDGIVTDTAATSGEATRPSAKVLLVPSRDAVDSVAASMLRLALPEVPIEWLTATSRQGSQEIIAMIAKENPDLVCVVALPPGGFNHARSLCARIRRRFPELEIVVGRWGIVEKASGEHEQLSVAGVKRMDAALFETAHLCERIAEQPVGLRVA